MTASPQISARADASHLRGFDGMRAIAVLLVIVAHYGWGDIVPGGFGVTLFFFISGFLIIRLLLSEWARTENVNLGSFYARRFARLAPPLLLFMALSYLAYIPLNKQPDLQQIGAVLFYYMNYLKSQYAILGLTSPMEWGHLWSLSVEEHYYFLLPAGLLFMLRRKLPVAKIFIAICAAVLLNRIVSVYVFDRPLEALYRATDSRIDSLLFGALLGYVLHAYGVEPIKRWLGWPIIAAAALVFLATLLIRDETFRQVYRYSIQNVCIALMVINLYFFAPLDRCVGWLEHPALVWVGKRSYEIYLWHFLVLAYAEHLLGVGYASQALSFALVFPVGALAYRAGTEPFLKLRAKLRT